MKRLLFALTMVVATITAVTLASCNVTRKITTESSYWQKGDTSCTITVKTTEVYDAVKKGAVQ